MALRSQRNLCVTAVAKKFWEIIMIVYAQIYYEPDEKE